ncbi:BNR-4 repeat-containing protein [Aeoliella sp.]|uniref:BNR-4 repeat-containing protein n=1 Tax=Aeoliella sp. TaxID=2795800 RepID=UPI003CCBB571
MRTQTMTVKIPPSAAALRFAGLVVCVSAVVGFRHASADNDVVGSLKLLNDNGAWSWFEDERIIIDAPAGKLLLSSVADASGSQGIARNGDIDIVSLDLQSGQVQRYVLDPGLQADDHNAAALLVRPDGRYLAVWNTHGSNPYHYSRVSDEPGDITSWGPTQLFDNGAGATYSNVYRLSADNGGSGRIYNFARTVGFNPNYNVSDDEGETWTYGGRLMTWTLADLQGDPNYTGIDGRRPYVRYTSNNEDEVHFITTEDHPRAYNNSIYHGYIKLVEGVPRVFHSDGTDLGPLSTTSSSPLKPNSFTKLFTGDADNVAWTSDIELDDQGRPFVAFSVQKDGAGLSRGAGGFDHRYFSGRWTGTNWDVHEMAFGGTKLYSGEDDYTGNIGLDPDNPDRVFISSDVHPETKTQLIGPDGQRHYELFRGDTTDGGATWKWTPVTYNSSTDNLRPIIPSWDQSNLAVSWMRGTYATYTNYDLDVVALVNPPDLNPEERLKVDFGATGQIIQSGFLPFSGAGIGSSASMTFSIEGDDVDLELAGQSLDFRDRGDDIAGPLGRVQDDFIFAQNELSLTFDTLAAGDYHLVLYSHDRNFEQAGMEILLENELLGQLLTETGVDPEVGTTSARIAFSSDGVSPVQLTLKSTAGANVVLNGVELYAVDFVSPPGPLAGDINGNGIVDVQDYRILLRYMSTIHNGKLPTQTYALGDLNGDLVTNFYDLVEFRTAFENVPGNGLLADAFHNVPEPSAVVVAGTGVLFCLQFRQLVF